MSAVDLVIPDAAEAILPFSVRLAERRNTIGTTISVRARTDRRAHLRRNATDLAWLRLVRLGQGLDVRLIDLSEGGALLEVDAPLKPGTILTLELSGTGLETSVPLEVLRCYISNLRGSVATYRGACAFSRLIELPLAGAPTPTSKGFVGTDAALRYLLDARGTLERQDVLHVLMSLHMRRATDDVDPMSRYAAQLIGAIVPALQRGAPKEVVTAALDAKLQSLPDRWQARLEPTRERIASLIDHCVAAPIVEASATAAPTGTDAPAIAAPESANGFQKIVVRYVDGDIVKGFTQDFHPSRAQFSLWPSINAAKSDRIVIPMGRLKAVFFVRDFNGNAGYRERKTFNTRGHGRRLEVTFHDNEVVVGTTLNYRPDGQGFFLIPVDSRGNNTRIFVVASAVRRVRFL
jgi:PilZ domain